MLLRHLRWLLPVVLVPPLLLLGRSPQPIAAGPPAPSGQQQAPSGPPARFGAAMAADSARGTVVLFGGLDKTTPLDDTWTWDGVSWTQHSPAVTPPARLLAGMVYDATRQQVVLFGGVGTHEVLGDTWTWDGSTWTERHPATSPPLRGGFGMAYDEAHAQVVLFGGLRPGTPLGDPSGLLNDTWTWDGDTWSLQQPATSPDARGGLSLAYDAAHGTVVLFGGDIPAPGPSGPNSVTPQYLNDTWLWDGSTWTKQSVTVAPPARENAAVAASPSGGVVLFGGEGNATRVSDTGWLNDTWLWDGSSWRLQAPPASPPAREYAAMATGPATGLVLFGGQACCQSGNAYALADTWRWDGGTWQPAGGS